MPSGDVLLLGPLTKLFRRRRAAITFTGLRADAAKRADLALLPHLVASGAFTPVIDRVDALADVVEAHRRAGTGRKVGAVVLVVDPRVPLPPDGAAHRTATEASS